MRNPDGQTWWWDLSIPHFSSSFCICICICFCICICIFIFLCNSNMKMTKMGINTIISESVIWLLKTFDHCLFRPIFEFVFHIFKDEKDDLWCPCYCVRISDTKTDHCVFPPILGKQEETHVLDQNIVKHVKYDQNIAKHVKYDQNIVKYVKLEV